MASEVVLAALVKGLGVNVEANVAREAEDVLIKIKRAGKVVDEKVIVSHLLSSTLNKSSHRVWNAFPLKAYFDQTKIVSIVNGM